MPFQSPLSQITTQEAAATNARHDLRDIINELYDGKYDITDAAIQQSIEQNIKVHTLKKFTDEQRKLFLSSFTPTYVAHDVNPPKPTHGTEVFPPNRQLEAGGKGGSHLPQRITFHGDRWTASNNLRSLSRQTLGAPSATESNTLHYRFENRAALEALQIASSSESVEEPRLRQKFLDQIRSLIPRDCQGEVLVSVEQGIDLNPRNDGYTSRTFLVIVACGTFNNNIFTKREEHWKCFTLHYKTEEGATHNVAHLTVLEPMDNRVSQAKVSATLAQIDFKTESRTIQRAKRGKRERENINHKASDRMLTEDEINSFRKFWEKSYGGTYDTIGRAQLALSIVSLKTMGDSQFRRFIRKTIRRREVGGIFHITTGDKRMFYILMNELNKENLGDLLVFLEYTGTPGSFLFKLYNATSDILKFNAEDQQKKKEEQRKKKEEEKKQREAEEKTKREAAEVKARENLAERRARAERRAQEKEKEEREEKERLEQEEKEEKERLEETQAESQDVEELLGFIRAVYEQELDGKLSVISEESNSRNNENVNNEIVEISSRSHHSRNSQGARSNNTNNHEVSPNLASPRRRSAALKEQDQKRNNTRRRSMIHQPLPSPLKRTRGNTSPVLANFNASPPSHLPAPVAVPAAAVAAAVAVPAPGSEDEEAFDAIDRLPDSSGGTRKRKNKNKKTRKHK